MPSPLLLRGRVLETAYFDPSINSGQAGSGRTGWIELGGLLEIICPLVLTRRKFCNVGGRQRRPGMSEYLMDEVRNMA